jgi:hypothetical protein
MLFFPEHYKGDQIKEGGACSTHDKFGNCTQIVIGKPEDLQNVVSDGRMLLK